MDIDLNKFRFPRQNYGLIIIAVVAAIGVLTIRLHADNKSADRASGLPLGIATAAENQDLHRFFLG